MFLGLRPFNWKILLISIKGSEALKQSPHELLWMLWFDEKSISNCTYVFRIITYGVVTDPFWMPFMDEAEDGAEEDVEDTEDEPTSLIALFLKKQK